LVGLRLELERSLALDHPRTNSFVHFLFVPALDSGGVLSTGFLSSLYGDRWLLFGRFLWSRLVVTALLVTRCCPRARTFPRLVLAATRDPPVNGRRTLLNERRQAGQSIGRHPIPQRLERHTPLDTHEQMPAAAEFGRVTRAQQRDALFFIGGA
jgi:hypothetical protein